MYRFDVLVIDMTLCQLIINVINSVLDYVISYKRRVKYELLPSVTKKGKNKITDCLGIVIRSGRNFTDKRSR